MSVLRWLAVVAVSLIAIPSAAGAIVLTVTVTTGTPLAAPGVTLTGVDQTKTFTIASKVVYDDNSGGGLNNAGWKVNVSATLPTVGGRSLPALAVTGVARGACTADTSGSCVLPTNTVSYAAPVTINTTPTKIYNATAGTGTGTVTLTATYRITYPSNAIAGTYSSTVTYAIATGP